jgi:ribosome modulation factor
MESEREQRARRAQEQGREARRAGEPIEACPYGDADQGLGNFWELGWIREEQRARRGQEDS